MPRQHERSEIRKEILLESASGKRETRISDLSLGGCYIESINIHRPGEDLVFNLHNDEGEMLRFTGRVAYVLEGQGFGLTFTDLTPEQLSFLEKEVGAYSGASV